MIEQTNNALKFRAFYVASKVGKTGLTVTVDVYNPADTRIVTAAAATEIGGGLYGYSLASGSVTAEGEYIAIFKTADSTVDAQHMAAVWVVGRAGIELLDKLDVGDPEAPVVVVPAPPADASMCTVYAYTEALTGVKRAGIEVSFKLSGKPGKSERILETAEVVATTDADGMLSINLQRTDALTPAGLYYLVTCRELGLSKVQMTLEAETFDLGGLIS